MGSYGDRREPLLARHIRHEIVEFIRKACEWRRRHLQLSVKAQPLLRNEDEVTGRLRVAPRSGIRALFRGPRFGSQLYFFQADFAEFFHPKESDDGNQLWGHVVKCLVARSLLLAVR